MQMIIRGTMLLAQEKYLCAICPPRMRPTFVGLRAPTIRPSGQLFQQPGLVACLKPPITRPERHEAARPQPQPGDTIESSVIGTPADIMVIPANVPHEFVFTEDTIDIDIFAPGRQDWLDGTAAYYSK
jgi:hypothetical protein